MAFEDIVASYPAIFMIVASFVIALLISVIYKYTTNQGEMKRLKGELKEMQAKMKESKDDKEKMIETQKQLASKNLEYMKHSFKPMIYTFIPVILIFWWLRRLYEETEIIFTIPVVGWGLNWIWTYIVFSFIFSLIIRKVMKVH